MKYGEISLNGYGDCHEDTDTEKDVVEGIEEVWEKMMMELCKQTSYSGVGGFLILKCSPDTF